MLDVQFSFRRLPRVDISTFFFMTGSVSYVLYSAVFFFLYHNELGCHQMTAQTNIKWIVNLTQSLTINLPHTQTFNLEYWSCHPSLSGRWQQSIPPGYTVILTRWLSSLTGLSVHKTKWQKYLLLREVVRILNKNFKNMAFAGEPWCFAICTNCS